MVTHRYCGILCYEASRNATVPASMIPAPAPAPASGRTDSIGLREEGASAPIGRKILLMMQERWDSDAVSMTKLKSIYRVDLPGQVYRRFDFALQANDGCTVVTTYYGAKAACDIANDSDPGPCNLESCSVCEAIRSAFSHLVYGASSADGKHGPGIYTFTNPALAHQAAVSDSSTRKRGSDNSNHVLIQCRVVTRGDSAQVTNPYAGFVDESGAVFCSQSMAIIPTHLLVYRIRATSPSSTGAVGTSSRPLVAIGPPRPRRTVKPPPVSPLRRSLPNAPTATPILRPATANVPILYPAFQPRSSLGEGPKPLQLGTYSVIPPSRRRRYGVSSVDDLYSTTPETNAGTKNNTSTEHTRATTLAPSTSLVDTITIEAPRKPPVIASPKPIRPVVLDPVYIPLPPSPGPPPSDPPVKKVAKKAVKSETKQPLTWDDEAVRSPAPAEQQDELPLASNANGSATPPKPYYSIFSVPPGNSMSSPYLFIDEAPATRSVPRTEDSASDDDGLISTQDTLSPQPIQQATPELCRNCKVQPQFSGFYYCSKTCASAADDKRKALQQQSVTNTPAPFIPPLGDTTVRAPAFSDYSSGRESTPPLASYIASGTAATSGQQTPGPAEPAGTQYWQAPTSDQNQGYGRVTIDSEALGDFGISWRPYQQRNDSYSSERGGEPRVGGYTGRRATFGIHQPNEQPVASGGHALDTQVGLTARLGDERPGGSATYLPSTSSIAPAPVVEAPAADDRLILMTPTLPPSSRDMRAEMTPNLPPSSLDMRAERGRSGDRFSLIKKWTNLGSDLRKGKNKD